MATEAASGMLVSNHSYGLTSGWRYDDSQGCSNTTKRYTWMGGTDQFNAGGDDPNFGRYDGACQNLDGLIWDAQYYLPVFSAGNSNSQNPQEFALCDDRVRNGDGGTYVGYEPEDHPAGNSSHNSNIPGNHNAKNILTVANLQADQSLNSSSSRGITDDGRIKPDICGKGTDLYSAESTGTAAYATKTGTSMASPNVAGSLILLQELYERRHGDNGTYMRNATLKGLAIHTATDLGNPGPDVAHGWGLLNANLAGDVISEDAWYFGTQHSLMLEREVANGIPEAMDYAVVAAGTEPLVFTLCYTDYPGTGTSTHNDPTTKLVNDLDLHVSGNGHYYPYVLQPNFHLPATSGDNDRDNVEQVRITNPVAGTVYTVHVDVEGSITGGIQPFSLIISGLRTSCYDSIEHPSVNIPTNTYNSSTLFTSTATIASGNTVNYRAGNLVDLKPGFRAIAGSTFNAKIQSCP